MQLNCSSFRIADLVLVGLLLLAFGCGVVSAAGETLALGDYRADVSQTVTAGETLKIPVTVSGYPRGLNQFIIEFGIASTGITVNDFAVTLDKTMIQHSAPYDPVVGTDSIQRRYLQTVKLVAYPDYGINQTAVGTIILHVPESAAGTDLVLSARIVESTSGAPLESMETPETGNISINVASAEKKATSAKRSLLSPFSIIAGAGAALAVAGILARRNSP